MENTQDLAAAAAAATARFPRHTFKIPGPKYGKDKDGNQVLLDPGVKELPTDPDTITLRQLTIEEEKKALAKAKLTPDGDFNYEGALIALVAADGKLLTWENDQKEQFFRGLSNKVRDLVIHAFQKTVLPTKAQSEDFLASEKIEVP